MVKIHLSNQNLLTRKLTFFLFLEGNICCRYSLEVPHRGTSNEYPQDMFSLRNKEHIYIYLIFWILFLARSMKYLSKTSLDRSVKYLSWTSKLKFHLLSSGINGTSWTSQAGYFHSPGHQHNLFSFDWIFLKLDLPETCK